ncbi:MAG: hypothetical protein G01um101466_741 [Parcubacteria group bacterium Gr01-1014_66]|nr:MAG: hypothetical protein G01um101466_741 [Parcubacteria group bacterium Gr01-1014_66]
MRSQKGSYSGLLISFVLIVFLIVAATGAWRMIQNAYTLYKGDISLDQEIAKLVQDKDEKMQRLAEWETPEAIERHAKDRLHLKNKGEEVLVITSEGTREKIVVSSSPLVSTAFFIRVLGFFGMKE